MIASESVRSKYERTHAQHTPDGYCRYLIQHPRVPSWSDAIFSAHDVFLAPMHEALVGMRRNRILQSDGRRNVRAYFA